MQILFVLISLLTTLGPAGPLEGGGSGDQSGKQLAVFLLDFLLLTHSIQGRIGLEVTAQRQLSLGRMLRLADQDEFACQVVVVLHDSLFLGQRQRAKRTVMDGLLWLVSIELGLCSHQVDEMTLVGLRFLHYSQTFFAAAKVPYIRVHYRINKYSEILVSEEYISVVDVSQIAGFP